MYKPFTFRSNSSYVVIHHKSFISRFYLQSYNNIAFLSKRKKAQQEKRNRVNEQQEVQLEAKGADG